jgi:hypothetical protein
MDTVLPLPLKPHMDTPHLLLHLLLPLHLMAAATTDTALTKCLLTNSQQSAFQATATKLLKFKCQHTAPTDQDLETCTDQDLTLDLETCTDQDLLALEMCTDQDLTLDLLAAPLHLPLALPDQLPEIPALALALALEVFMDLDQTLDQILEAATETPALALALALEVFMDLDQTLDLTDTDQILETSTDLDQTLDLTDMATTLTASLKSKYPHSTTKHPKLPLSLIKHLPSLQSPPLKFLLTTTKCKCLP